MPAKGSKILGQDEYNTIKALLGAGVTKHLISKSLNRSWALIQQVEQSETLEDYKEIGKKRWSKKPQEKAELVEEANVVMGGGEGSMPVPFNVPEAPVSTPTADVLKIFNKIDELISRLDKIIDYEEAREASVKVNGWKLGRSR